MGPIIYSKDDNEAKKIFKNERHIIEAARKGTLLAEYDSGKMKINPNDLILRDYFMPPLISLIMLVFPEIKEAIIRNEIYEILAPDEKLSESTVSKKLTELNKQMNKIKKNEEYYESYNNDYKKMVEAASKKASKNIVVDEFARDELNSMVDEFQDQFPDHVNTKPDDTNTFYGFVKDILDPALKHIADPNNDKENSFFGNLKNSVFDFFENGIDDITNIIDILKCGDEQVREEKVEQIKDAKRMSDERKLAQKEILQLSKKIEIGATNAQIFHNQELQKAETEEDQKYLTDRNLFEYLSYTYNRQINMLVANGLIMDDEISNAVVSLISSFFVLFDTGTTQAKPKSPNLDQSSIKSENHAAEPANSNSGHNSENNYEYYPSNQIPDVNEFTQVSDLKPVKEE